MSTGSERCVTLWLGALHDKSPTKFRGQRHCDSGDMLALACHVISQDNVLKESSDFMGGSL